MSWKQLRVVLLALIFGLVLAVLLKTIVATLTQKGKEQPSASVFRTDSLVLESLDLHTINTLTSLSAD